MKFEPRKNSLLTQVSKLSSGSTETGSSGFQRRSSSVSFNTSPKKLSISEDAGKEALIINELEKDSESQSEEEDFEEFLGGGGAEEESGRTSEG